jgi:hypothetical protein
MKNGSKNIPLDITDVPVKQTYITQITETGITVMVKSKWLNAFTYSNANQYSSFNRFTFVNHLTYANLFKLGYGRIFQKLNKN